MSQPLIHNAQLAGPLFFDTTAAVIVNKVPGPGEFSSIKAAVDSITTATFTTPVAVFVGPGWYTEPTITIPPYVKLIGWAGETHTFIVASAPNQHAVVASNSSMIQGFSVTGVTGAGYAGVYFASTSNSLSGTFRLQRMRFIGNPIDLHIEGSTFVTYVVADELYFVLNNNVTTTHMKINNPSSGEMQTLIHSIGVSNLSTFGTSLSEAVLVDGSNNFVRFNGVNIQAVGGSNATGDGLVAQNGAILECIAGAVTGYNKNVVTRNIGTAPKIQISVNLSTDSTTRDVSIEHPGTTGLFTGAADQLKVFVDPASPIAIQYTDTDVDPGTVIAGRLYMGPNHSNATDMTQLFNESLPTGVLSGGTIVAGVNPLDISVSSGYGYVGLTNTVVYMKKLVWNTTTLTLPDNTNSYVYINSSGTVTSAASQPDSVANILLGRVRTSGGAIAFISQFPQLITHISSRINTFLQEAIGPVYKSGSVVTENVTPFHLNVSNGDYFYSHLEYLPAGGTNINFFPWSQVTGTWSKGASTNVVSNTQYNNVATGLVALTATYFTKHALYVGGDGANEQYQLVYGQAEYSSLVAAEQAPLPSPPPVFTDIVVPVAAIIVQQGAANITEFIDIRPRIGFQNPSTSAATVHGNLLGLNADDHPQYLLVSGTRAMTGNLNLGGNNITNVGTVAGTQPHANILDSISALTLSGGDLILGTGAATVTRLGIGTNGYVLASNGSAPVWTDPNTITNPSRVANPVAVTTASHTITATEDYVGVNFAGAVALTLNTVNNKIVYIKDESFAAGTPGNTITITPSTGQIEGQANITITVNGMALALICRAGNWFVI